MQLPSTLRSCSRIRIYHKSDAVFAIFFFLKIFLFIKMWWKDQKFFFFCFCPNLHARVNAGQVRDEQDELEILRAPQMTAEAPYAAMMHLFPIRLCAGSYSGSLSLIVREGKWHAQAKVVEGGRLMEAISMGSRRRHHMHGLLLQCCINEAAVHQTSCSQYTHIQLLTHKAEQGWVKQQGRSSRALNSPLFTCLIFFV